MERKSWIYPTVSEESGKSSQVYSNSLSLGSGGIEVVTRLSSAPHSSETVGPVVVSVAQVPV